MTLLKSIKAVTCILLLNCLFLSANAEEQHSKNGFWLPVADTLRVLVVYAELKNYAEDKEGTSNWPRGSLPNNPETYFYHDTDFSDPEKGYLSRYFYQASFGNYIVLGDYVDTIVTLDYARKQTQDRDVIRFLNNLPGDDIITANGYSINSGDFDKWTSPERIVRGAPKLNESDENIDLLMIVWRRNPDINRTDNSGSISVWRSRMPLKQKSGFFSASRFVSANNDGYRIIRHEYAHALLGGNNFHTQGGAGNRKTLSIPGGYSLLSSNASLSRSWSAFDRWRLNWKPNDNKPDIFALDISGKTVSADIDGHKKFSEKRFVLRDFITYGDAIRIELPHIQKSNPDAQRQYLWLENRQMLDGNEDHDASAPHGIYANIQIGKDDRSDFGEANNHLWFVNAFGNYDVEFDFDSEMLLMRTWLPNTFTGYHMSKEYFLPPPNENPELLPAQAHHMAAKLAIDGREIDDDAFRFRTFPIFGNKWDAFKAGDKINLSENPSPVPLMTFETPRRGNAYREPKPHDNRFVQLNGLEIEFTETIQSDMFDGKAIEVVVRNLQAVVENDVRWCGPVVLFDSLRVKRFATISLERGKMPVRPNEPVKYNGNYYYNEATTLHLRAGTETRIESGAELLIRDDSKLIVDKGASLILEKGAIIRIENDAFLALNGKLYLQDGAKIYLRNHAKLKLNESAVIDFNRGAELLLEEHAFISGF